MRIKTSITARRRHIYIIITTLIIITLFTGLYFTKYVPQNKAELNQRGFRILKQIVDNVKDKNREYKRRLNKNINSAYKQLKDTAAYRERIINLISSRITANNFIYKGGDTIVKDPCEADTARTKEILVKDETWKLQYKTVVPRKDKNFESYLFQVDLANFLSEILSYRRDIFDSYIIIKKDTCLVNNKSFLRDTIIYQSPGLALGNVVNYDSLFNSKYPLTSSKITECEISGIDYKLFLQPLEIQGQPLLLAGLIKASAYNKIYLTVSPSFLYNVSIILMIFVLSFPFLKIAFIASAEKLSVKDVLKAGLSLVTGTSIIVIIITNWFFSHTAKDQATNKLVWLANNIEDSFLNEIKCAYKQIKEYDAQAAIDTTLSLDSLRNAGNTLFIHPKWYKTFDQVFWINKKGMQNGKWETNNRSTPYLEISDRDYFNKIIKNEAYTIPVEDSNAIFYIDPIFSYISGEFKINISTRSDYKKANKGVGDTAEVVGIASRSYNETAPILPREYSFCITDNTGKVLIHSDLKRSLKENVLEEMNQDISLQEAFKKRDERIIDDVEYYGKNYQLHIKAIPDLPLFLIVMFNQDRLHNTTNRVFAFSLSLSLLIVLLVTVNHTIYREVKRSFSKLFLHLNRFKWFKPQTNSRLLQPFSKFIIRYVCFVLAFILIDFLINVRHAGLLFYLAVLLPFYTYWGMVFIQDSFAKGSKTQTLTIFILSVTLLNTVIFYCIAAGEKKINTSTDILNGILDSHLFYVILFQLLSILFIKVFKRSYRNGVNDSRVNKIVRDYCITVTLIVIVVSVIPPIALVCYGFHEEKQGAEKLNQLQLAQDLQARNIRIVKRHVKEKAYKTEVYENIYDKNFLEYLKFKKNIFVTDSIIPDHFLYTAHSRANARDSFLEMDKSVCYENMLSLLQKSDYASDSIYQMENSSGDSAFFWGLDKRKASRINLIYNGIGEIKAPVRIISTNTNEWNKVNFPLLTLFILLLTLALYSIYLLVKYITNRVFLIGYTKAFTYCDVKEDFLEKFSEHIRVEKLVVLDEKGGFLSKIRPFHHAYDFIKSDVVKNMDDLLREIHASTKRIVILDKEAEILLKKLSVTKKEDLQYFLGLSKINSDNNINCDCSTWNINLIVTPNKLPESSKINEALIKTNDEDLWNKSIITYLSKNFKLFLKNQYIKGFQQRLLNQENPKKLSSKHDKKHFSREDLIISTQHEFEASYQLLWQDCSEEEKYVLYEFAEDGFANYKNEQILNSLIKRGILIYRKDELRFFNASFKNFLLTKTGTEEIEEIHAHMATPGKWNVLKITVFIIIISLALFVMLTQEETFKKITAVLASLVAVVPMLMKFFQPGKSSDKISR